jgi:curved DNA-binding protein CbpA
MSNRTSYYDHLQISSIASPSVIRAAYKALSQKCHPDKHQNSLAQAHEEFHLIKQAYDVLSNPVLRQRYDDRLKIIKQAYDLISIPVLRRRRDDRQKITKPSYDATSNPVLRRRHGDLLKIIEAEKNLASKKSQQLFEHYTFRERKPRISVIV